MIPFRTITLEDLKQKKLQLEESYNFKEEEDKSWSFEFKNRKAFLINLADPANRNIITPFILRRGQLGIICDSINDQLENGEKPTEIREFLNFSIEVIGNLLDKQKMGSVEYFINLIWKDIKDDNEANNYLNVISILSDIVIMIDYSSESHFATISQEDMKSIHHDYFNVNSDKVFRIYNDGRIERVSNGLQENDSPEDKYNLADMRPINSWEI